MLYDNLVTIFCLYFAVPLVQISRFRPQEKNILGGSLYMSAIEDTKIHKEIIKDLLCVAPELCRCLQVDAGATKTDRCPQEVQDSFCKCWIIVFIIFCTNDVIHWIIFNHNECLSCVLKCYTDVYNIRFVVLVNDGKTL